MKKRSFRALDTEDTLAKYRQEFYLPKGVIYLDGNSLGLLSLRAEETTLNLLDSWKKLGIEGWTKGENPWFFLAEKLGQQMAPLVGALPEEVVITGSTTINLHQLLATFYKPTGKKFKILADELAFPTDIYAIQSQLTLHGYDPEKALVKVMSRDGVTLNERDILNSLTDEVAVAILPSVLYRSGQLLNIGKIAQVARENGIVLGIDASHSVGAVPHEFHSQGIDFAFWCTYKYLNGGPGSVAALFVHQKHLGVKPGLAGWFSSDKHRQFEMSHQLSAAPDAGAYQIGTPSILSMAALIGSLSLFEEVGISKLRQKSEQITSYLIDLVDQELTDFGAIMVTPRDTTERGGHIAITHSDAALIAKSLRKRGVIPDFRPPNIIRLAPIPFYTSYQDVYDAIQIIKSIISSQDYMKDLDQKEIVT